MSISEVETQPSPSLSHNSHRSNPRFRGFATTHIRNRSNLERWARREVENREDWSLNGCRVMRWRVVLRLGKGNRRNLDEGMEDLKWEERKGERS